jgi:hypothetical protein
MSQDICKARTHGCGFGPWSFSGLVVLVEVDLELSEEFSGDRVDDADLEVLDEQDDVGSADADVTQFARDAECFIFDRTATQCWDRPARSRH